jgi:hypothetical protein
MVSNTSGRRSPRAASARATAQQSPSTRGDVASLEQTVQELQRTVMLIAEANAVPNLIANSFDEISARLEPLRNLAPYVEPLGRHAMETLRQLRDDHKRPDWGVLGEANAAGQPRIARN